MTLEAQMHAVNMVQDRDTHFEFREQLDVPFHRFFIVAYLCTREFHEQFFFDGRVPFLDFRLRIDESNGGRERRYSVSDVAINTHFASSGNSCRTLYN